MEEDVKEMGKRIMVVKEKDKKKGEEMEEKIGREKKQMEMIDKDKGIEREIEENEENK